MNDLFYIQGVRVFSLREAREILPVIQKITEETSLKVEDLLTKLQTKLQKSENSDRNLQKSLEQDLAQHSLQKTEIEQKIDQAVDAWRTKISKLGAKPNGIWVADFDSGDGYFCWKYPEPRLIYWHGYKEGFSNRIRIDLVEGEKEEPNWSNEISVGTN